MPAAGAHQPTFFSLRGPAKALHQRAREARELSEWMGELVGGWVDGDQKCPSIFLLLMYNKHHVYMYLYMYSKVVTKILMGFKI